MSDPTNDLVALNTLAKRSSTRTATGSTATAAVGIVARPWLPMTASGERVRRLFPPGYG